MSRLVIISLLVLGACEEKPQDSHAGQDSAADTGEQSTLTLAQDDVAEWVYYYSSAAWAGTITEDGADGTIAYVEYLNEAEPVCTATLAFSASPLDGDCSGGCAGADWGHALPLSVVESTGTCLYSDPDITPGLGAEPWTPYFAHFTDVVDTWGDHYDELAVVGAYDETDTTGVTPVYAEEDGVVSVANWSPSGEFNYWAEVGVGQYQFWTDCGLDEVISADTSFLTEEAEAEDLLGETIDLWTVQASAGQILRATLDTTTADVVPEISLVNPDGCRIGTAVSEVSCDSGEGTCPSVELELPQGGLWSLAVAEDLGNVLEYRLSVQVQ